MRRKISVLFISIVAFWSCGKDTKPTLVDSTGRINEVLIVMKNSDWTGVVGDSIKQIILTPLDGLPQEEAQFSVNQVSPTAFNNLFKRTRNILFIGYGDGDNNFYANKNIYASPQITLTVLGQNEQELLANISKHKQDIINTFKNNDLAVYQQKVTKDHYNAKSVETFNKLGFTLKLPRTYKKVEDSGDFLWYRNDFGKGQMNLIAFEIPYLNGNDFKWNHIHQAIDTITKYNIPGQFDNTYMMIEKRYDPIIKSLKLADLNALEARGLWVVKDDFMGGPFITYAIADKPNQRILILEGFSYSPATKKRDFVFEMEAILKTIAIGN